MANEYLEVADRVEAKMMALVRKCEQDRATIEALEARLKESNELLARAHAQVADLQQRLSSIRTAKTIAVTPEERTAAIGKIDRMVREIDKCLALLAVQE